MQPYAAVNDAVPLALLTFVAVANVHNHRVLGKNCWQFKHSVLPSSVAMSVNAPNALPQCVFMECMLECILDQRQPHVLAGCVCVPMLRLNMWCCRLLCRLQHSSKPL